MRVLTFILVTIILASCCPCDRKCNSGVNYKTFRIVDAANGYDLVFGLSEIYNYTNFKLYSLNGLDAIFHHIEAVSNYNPATTDSFLQASFDYSNRDTVFILLNQTDVDSMHLNYRTFRAACCGDYSEITAVRYNNNLLQAGTDGITVIKK